MMPVGNKDLEEGGRKKGRQINGFMIKRFGLFAGRINRSRLPPPRRAEEGKRAHSGFPGGTDEPPSTPD
jgi:hypothetical protein